jgi:hypothetical protein
MTWRTFNTRRNAELYEFACWLRLLRRHAAAGDGTLRNIVTNLRERVVDEWPDDHDSLRTMLQGMTNQELLDLRARVDNLPQMGRRASDNRLNEVDGYTLRWDEPRETAAGTWAVQCPPFDDGGGPEPEWPTPPDLIP